MLKNKKAQGLSLNTIIIASLVLIVLVVLILIFSGRMGLFNIGLNEATNEKNCVDDDKYERHIEYALPCEIGTYSIGPYDNVGQREYCCVEKI